MSIICGNTILRTSQATLPITSVPVWVLLRRLTLQHSVTHLLVLALQHSETASKAVETLSNRSVLPAIALLVLRLSSTVGIMSGILWRQSGSTMTLALPHGRIRCVRHRDGTVPLHHQYLVRWLEPMPDN
ncbi:hypothetical protein PF005_g23675 [Phytophthora fragariae]|uniref:Uncharacterized protein n=1 Tax=Phytophthora fragariae TaxID=53985 RepID=A0A6A4BR34_9STRA|nr:hypothetical protein PF007_g23674 [Phytophthora fragariae]KAE9080784.1 hypothetical protein PF010_g22253 [Phytophthora fragariae]KAE9085275.1 hypothetical protein PF006_g26291 [Phytophthora fragariae]KAE9179473.1 hypothetical protein PF005_g23675 [Phytophthora fragariae]KAE9181785.1 hypothetical protein PF004_g24431 [Phytophthora fragariae]